MSASKKSKNPLFPILLVAALAVILGAMFYRLETMGYFGKGGHLPDYGAAPDFSLTERDGQPFGRTDLNGKVWIASFIFTRCPGPCPFMSLRTQELLGKVKGLTAVSFTSDPGYDTPEVLAGYAKKYKADADRWLFLTGAKEEMSRIAKEFKFGGMDVPDMHSTRFVLVDSKGLVRGYYDSNDPEHLARLTKDARELIGR